MSIISEIAQTIQIMKGTVTTLKYYFKYFDVKTGNSTMGAIGVVARLTPENINFVIRFVQATHNTPQPYGVETSWRSFTHPKTCNSSVYQVSWKYNRALNATEILAIQNALSSTLKGSQQLLLAQ